MRKIKYLGILFYLVFIISGCSTETVDFRVTGSNEEIEWGQNYSDKGATAITSSGDSIAVIVDNKVDTNRVGTYQVIYTINFNGETSNRIRTVTVIPPKLNQTEEQVVICMLAIRKRLNNPDSLILRNVLNFTDGTRSENDVFVEIQALSLGGQSTTTPWTCAFPGSIFYDSTTSRYTKDFEFRVNHGQDTYNWPDFFGGGPKYASERGYNIENIMYYVARNQRP
jgi:hypothetical protein